MFRTRSVQQSITVIKRFAQSSVPATTQGYFFSSKFYNLAKKAMPRISDTEAAALNAGTVGFDRDIFTGSPDFTKLMNYSVSLSEKEKKFMTTEVEELCKLVNDYQINKDKDLPKEVWDYIRRNKFLGMIIPEKYGGLGFTPHGHSQIVQKIATRSGPVAVSVMVPNSLGPGELLLRYGTEEQKNYFLPKLANGDLIPCFGLTGPASGSDAAAMRDFGIVVEENGVLGVRATFKKRYITLAPVAGVVGLAFRLDDPNGLLKGLGKEGITIALLERDHPGLQIGRRHDPLSSAFMNGPVEGDNIFIPIDKILGGQERCGFGWNMLMDCLAEGRGVSLPASSVAAGKFASYVVGAYARIRKQFKVPIADLEGVQEHLARIASNTFIMTSAQHLTNAILNNHEQPAVISAIMKQQMTSRMRIVVNDAMDVMGGAAICNGPANFMANCYQAVPVAITVEGANTLTRSLIQFGQGLTRSHPHLYSLIKTIQDGNDVKGFHDELINTITHGVKNFNYSFKRSVSSSIKSIFSSTQVASLEHYEAELSRYASSFAFASDLAMTLGGKIKFAEMLSGRYADILSNLYLGYATLWFYSHNRNVKDIDTILDYSMKTILFDIQTAFEGLQSNFPNLTASKLIKLTSAPFGQTNHLPRDQQVQKVASLITNDTQVRDLLSEAIYVPSNPDERVALIVNTFKNSIEVDKLLKDLKKTNRKPTNEEQQLINEVEDAREKIIQVDSFEKLGTEEFLSLQDATWTTSKRPALQPIKLA